MKQLRYSVLTWDSNSGKFTPQKGVRKIAVGRWGLRRALRALQSMGYDGTKQDNSTLVERIRR